MIFLWKQWKIIKKITKEMFESLCNCVYMIYTYFYIHTTVQKCGQYDLFCFFEEMTILIQQGCIALIKWC